MVRLRVFVGAPSAVDVDSDPVDYIWQTLPRALSLVPYPPATLDAASRRISLLYQNVIFDSISEQDQEPEYLLASPQDDDDVLCPERTSILTWAHTPAANTTGAPSFLRPSGSIPHATYETRSTGSSIEHSDASSIARFPNFQFSLHSVTPLSALYSLSGKGSRKVNVLLAALEVQGPDAVRVRNGPDAGKELSILKLILGDDQGSVCKLTAWRDAADAWGGFGPSPGLKRGDILYFQNLMAAWETGSAITLTASPHNKPTVDICYRTMPYTTQDNRLRPDLRLGRSDVVVNKVAALAQWFEDMAGLPGA